MNSSWLSNFELAIVEFRALITAGSPNSSIPLEEEELVLSAICSSSVNIRDQNNADASSICGGAFSSTLYPASSSQEAANLSPSEIVGCTPVD